LSIRSGVVRGVAVERPNDRDGETWASTHKKGSLRPGSDSSRRATPGRRADARRVRSGGFGPSKRVPTARDSRTVRASDTRWLAEAGAVWHQRAMASLLVPALLAPKSRTLATRRRALVQSPELTRSLVRWMLEL